VRIRVGSLAAVTVVGVLAAGVGPAAALADGAKAPEARQSAPSGYQVVDSGLLTAAPFAQTTGRVTCPGSTVVLGGGALLPSSSTDVNLNSSFPSGRHTWIAIVNNRTTSFTTFSVQAVCAVKPLGYTVVTASATSLAGLQAHQLALCPGRKVPIGGGEQTGSTSLVVNVNTSIPNGPVWTVEMNNGSTLAQTFLVFAICARKPVGYALVSSGPVANPSGEQSGAQVTCPANTVPFGGGAFSTSRSLAVNINTTNPLSLVNGWQVFENNASPDDAQVSAFLVCAGS
jgi:hypothetical protein